MTTMTQIDTTSPLGRALAGSMLVAGARTSVADMAQVATVIPVSAESYAHVQAPAHPAYATKATGISTARNAATAVATNPWLGGSGSGEGMGNCATTFVDHSIKRIHPGRLEGMT